MEACNHPSEDVDREREPWPILHRSASYFIDQKDVRLGVIDLDDFERSRG